MFQVPADIWQQIADAHPEVKRNRWGRAMAGGADGITRLDEETSRELTTRGVENRVQIGFCMMAPLLVNNAAIQAWLRDTDSLRLAETVLLDVESPEEAAAIATMEYPMTPEQTATLVELLSEELARSQESITEKWLLEIGQPVK